MNPLKKSPLSEIARKQWCITSRTRLPPFWGEDNILNISTETAEKWHWALWFIAWQQTPPWPALTASLTPAFQMSEHMGWREWRWRLGAIQVMTVMPGATPLVACPAVTFVLLGASLRPWGFGFCWFGGAFSSILFRERGSTKINCSNTDPIKRAILKS